MCGITGFMRSCAPTADRATLRRMGEAIMHRGPDASGEYLDDWIGLGHRRLSIIDLSARGNQPMRSADGRYWIVFNGEIYNFSALRSALEQQGVCFSSDTDTEVLLALYQRQGKACLDQLNGMFAFAVWDRAERTLFLARDRIGKKPLYYYHGGGDRLAFASEIKALLPLLDSCPSIEPTAVADFLTYLYIPAPRTIFKNIYKLQPGHCLTLQAGGEPVVTEYWDLALPEHPATIGIEDAADQLLELLRDSTACRMVADVPLGAFLSGGIDSSAVVALMAAAAKRPVITCSIGFPDREHDESTHARAVAARFATRHTEYRMGPDLAETVPLLPRYFDEPFADSSALPTYHLCRLARQQVTVALAGDGGDENFGGYSKYRTDLQQDLVRQGVPRFLLEAVSLLTAGSGGRLMRRAHSLAASALCDQGRAYVQTNSCIAADTLNRLFSPEMQKLCRGYDPATPTLASWERTRGADLLTRMLYTDIKTYLPGDILVKVDRMSMAHALEVRAPLLDHRVVSFAAALPSNLKIRGGSKKFILKHAFRDQLPPLIRWRPKHGFTVPLNRWFRHELRSLGEQLLLDSPQSGRFFAPASVRQLWQEHQQGSHQHGTLLWSLLSFALWQHEYQV